PFRHRQRKDTRQMLGNGRKISIVHGIDQFGALAQRLDPSVRRCVENVEEFPKRRIEWLLAPDRPERNLTKGLRPIIHHDALLEGSISRISLRDRTGSSRVLDGTDRRLPQSSAPRVLI